MAKQNNTWCAPMKLRSLYMANLGCIEMNPWHSTTKKPENPSWCVIDLDPDGKITFEQSN